MTMLKVTFAIELPSTVTELRVRETDDEAGPLWVVEGKHGPHSFFHNLFVSDSESAATAVFEAFQNAIKGRV